MPNKCLLRCIAGAPRGALSAGLLCFFEEITEWVDEGSPVDIIYFDFQKAFDKVPHQRLILKLKSEKLRKLEINTNYKMTLIN